MLHRTMLLHLVVVLALSGLASPSGAADIQSVQNSTLTTLQQEQKSQKETDQWSNEKQALANEILEQKTRLQWDRYQNTKYQEYIERKKADIAELQRQKEKMQQLRMALEPYLDETLQRLEAFVASDLPFLAQERADRLHFLTDSLADPDLDLSEKLRRVLEGLKAEADYGNNIEVTSEKLELEGGETQVDVLRLGRVALFYMTRDGRNLGRWDASKKSWVAIDRDYASSLQLAMDIAAHKRAAELVELPLGRID